MSDLLTAEEREEISRRVSSGAVMFDERGPVGWSERLYASEEILDVASVYRCPLAILYGGYGEGLAALGLLPGEASRLGFTIVCGDGLDEGSHGRAWDNAAFDAMTQDWRREARGRLAAVST